MTQTTAPLPTSSTTTATGLRGLYLVRAVVSLVWVALVFATASDLTSPETPTAIAAVLLVLYPLWDAAATLLDRRRTGSTDRVGALNVALGVAAGAAMLVAVLSTVGHALLVFGVWALLSGAIQLTVALRRRHEVGLQWPMLVSGGLSVLAGASFAASSGSDSSDLSGIAGYSAFGAFWFLVAAGTLTLRARRHP